MDNRNSSKNGRARCPKIVQLTLDVNEARAIDASLKEDRETLDDYRWFLLQIGRCIVEKTDVTIGLSEQDLWFLRDKVSIGVKGGLEALVKVYRLLLEFDQDRLYEAIQMPPIVANSEVENAGCQDQTKDYAEDTAES